MIDHFEIKVRNLQISKDFYTSFLSPLGYKLAFRSSSLLSFLRFTLLFWQKTMSRFKLVMRLV